MARALDELFAEVLERYPRVRHEEKFGRESSFWPLIGEVRAGLEAALLGLPRIKVKVSFGQGGWAEVPNFAILDTKETARPSAGIYVVYLVRADGGGVVLSLNQGSADLFLEVRGRAVDVLKARASRLRVAPGVAALEARGFTTTAVELASDGQYPRAYAAGNVVGKLYQVDAMPGGPELVEDLWSLVTTYQELLPSRRWIERRG